MLYQLSYLAPVGWRNCAFSDGRKHRVDAGARSAGIAGGACNERQDRADSAERDGVGRLDANSGDSIEALRRLPKQRGKARTSDFGLTGCAAACCRMLRPDEVEADPRGRCAQP